jgi:ParB/Sulfiredoxin domain
MSDVLTRPKQTEIAPGAVVFDKDYYPRTDSDWQTVSRYTDAMRTGSEFPPITVVYRGEEPILLDGWHRVQAAKHAKIESLPCAVLDIPESEWFAKAVKLNAKNSRPLTVRDRAMIAHKLKVAGYDLSAISAMVHATPPNIVKWLGLRSVDEEGKEVFDAPTHSQGQKAADKNGPPPDVNPAFLRVTNEILAHLRAGSIDADHPVVKTRLIEIRDAIDNMVAE